MMQSNNNGPQSRQNRRYQERQDKASTAVMSKQSPLQTNQSDPKGDDPKPKSYDHVIARWTRVLGISTIILAIATVISSVFLVRTDGTIGNQLSTSQLQLRAYAGTSQWAFVPAYQPQAGAQPNVAPVLNGYVALVSWKNFGATPALSAQNWVSGQWYFTGTEPDFTRPLTNSSEHPVINLLPGVEWAGGTIFFPLSDVTKEQGGSGNLFLWGHIDYRDVFSTTVTHNFNFCMLIVSQAGSTLTQFRVYKPECNNSD